MNNEVMKKMQLQPVPVFRQNDSTSSLQVKNAESPKTSLRQVGTLTH